MILTNSIHASKYLAKGKHRKSEKLPRIANICNAFCITSRRLKQVLFFMGITQRMYEYSNETQFGVAYGRYYKCKKTYRMTGWLFHLEFVIKFCDWKHNSLRKQPTFSDVATCTLAKRRLSNERRNSILMTRHYPDLGSASDWLKCQEISFQPIRSTTLIWVVTRHQYGISALVTQMSFC